MNYSLYFQDEGRYTIPMTWWEVKKLQEQFPEGMIVNMKTGSVIG